MSDSAQYQFLFSTISVTRGETLGWRTHGTPRLLSGAKFSFGKWVRRRAANRRSPFRITRWSESRGELFGACGFSVGDVDQIVGDDAEADPAVHVGPQTCAQ